MGPFLTRKGWVVWVLFCLVSTVWDRGFWVWDGGDLAFL